jgi:MULE transposase domain
MASSIARYALQASQTYQILPIHQRQPWLKKAEALGPVCDKPFDGEVFEDHKHCLRRLNSWGFIEGCAYVLRRSRPSGTPNWTFNCIFHSEKTQNNHHLEARVVRDEESGEIVTKRQRDSHNKRKGCKCEYRLSYKLISRASEKREYTGQWRIKAHSEHLIPLNPFSFKIHLSAVDEFQQLQTVARKYRLSNQPYSEACKLLKQESLGLILKPKQYYNLMRNLPGDSSNADTITGLLQALQDYNFRFRTLTKDELDESGEAVCRRNLQQIVFWYSEGLTFIQRFCPEHLLVVDGTFNTNSKRLPLLVSVGVTNEGRIFPIAYSYCPGETAESFLFFFETLRAEIFCDGIPEPAVVLTDQAAGFISAVNTYNCLPNSQLQFYNWHAVEAMVKRFRKGKYTSDEIDGYRNSAGEEVPGLKDLCWFYVESITLKDLDLNRQRLLDRLQPAEYAYIEDNWRDKEERVIAVYTRKYRNLGANASQRAESFHTVMHQVTHG